MHGWRLHCGTVALLTAVFVGSCRGHPNGPTDALTFAFDFRGGPQGFVAGFADYPPADADLYELTADYRTLPPPLASQSALFISGVNRSDDLFMFFKRPIAGLSPGGRYIVTVSVEIATDTPAGCFGVGGAPGESVWIKAGATAIEPLAIRDGSYLRMNIDIGNQSVAATAFRPPRFGQRLQRTCVPGPSPLRQVRGIQTLARPHRTLPSPVLRANHDCFTAPQVDEDIEVGIHASEAST